MARPKFEELPLFRRPDLTPYLIHLTKNTKAEDGFSDYDNLVNILKTGEIWGSSTSKGFIKGKSPATCLMDVPFSSLKYVINSQDSDPERPRYEPFGVVVTKKYGYSQGCRPVLYLSDEECRILKVPPSQLWRVVRLEVDHDNRWVSWLHEREWRCRGDLRLPRRPVAVLVRNTKFAERLQRDIDNNPKKFKAAPCSIIPMTVLCQGLTYL